MPPDPNGPTGDLDTDARALYRKLRKFLEDSGQWENGYRERLSGVCRDAMVMRVAYAGIPRDERGNMILTTQGRSENSGEVAHPNVRTAEAASKRYMDGLDSFGFSPAARARLNIEPKAPAGKFGGAFGG